MSINNNIEKSAKHKKSTKRKVPPSRLKYEQNNPVVSGRVPIKIKNKLKNILDTRGIKFNQFLCEIIEKKEDDLFDLIEEAEIRGCDIGYEAGVDDGKKEGYKKGYQEALNVVVVKCSKCEKAIKIDLKSIPQAGQEVAKALKSWHHGGECPK